MIESVARCRWRLSSEFCELQIRLGVRAQQHALSYSRHGKQQHHKVLIGALQLVGAMSVTSIRVLG
jgi:hypothetical protein